MVVRRNTAQRTKKALGSAAIAALGLAAPSGVAHADSILYTGQEVTYTAAVTGTYEIVAYGAQGGGLSYYPFGGLGAEIGGFFSLAAGTQLAVSVGGQGFSGHYSGGGGGGSFVYNSSTSSLLLVAGGGGGTSVSQGAYIGSLGGAGQTGQGANPGSAGSNNYGAGGGGGFSGSASGPTGGQGYPSLAGGSGMGYGASNGGFGGGGGSATHYGGGGGGFSGGGGGSVDNVANYGTAGGGGGYSFNIGTAQFATAGFQSGNGEVDITFIPAAVPEPASVVLMATGFAALAAGAAWSRRRA